MWAAEEGHLGIMKRLLDKNAEIDARNNAGGTALMWTAFEKKPDAALMLLTAGANPNLQDDKGFTACIISADLGDQDTMTHILAFNANTSIQDNTGASALHAAATKGHIHIMRQLIKAGSPLELKDQEGGFTPLMISSSVNNLPAVELLIESGAQVDAAGSLGNTALLIAVQEDFAEIASYLIEKGADKDRADTGSSWSPLMHAVWFENKNVMKVLMESKASCNHRGKNNVGVLDIADGKGAGLAGVLRKYCARLVNRKTEL
eukprot:m.330506 g.330506  ORF g.330506 m.330506 type:complete len:262 (+) comp16584_c0_seq4:663-1448(+)